MVIIEDVEGVENLPEILEVDHIDAYFVAPVDLSQSMGLVGRPDHPDVAAAVDAAIAKIAGAGRVPGTLVVGRPLSHYVDLGVRLFLVPWVEWVMEGGRAYLDRANAAR
jgi:4-hydroxy-2-oxoheptanedioate aldolase